MLSLTHLLVAMVGLAPALAAQGTTAPLGADDGRILFSVAETFADASGHTRLVLRVATERPSRCNGPPLTARVTQRGDTIAVDRWRVAAGASCLDGPEGVFTATIPLGAIEGDRVLEIAHLGVVDRYRLAVTGESIRVVPIDSARATVLRDTTILWRFPRDSFTFRCGTHEHTTWMCAEVFHLLADVPGIVPIDLPPTGRDPYADYGASGREPARFFRVATLSSYGRLTREIQRLYDLYAGPRYDFGIYTRQRFDFDVAILRWTGERWQVARPVRPVAEP